MKYKAYILLFLVLILVSSCEKSTQLTIVDDEIQVYFDSFETESKIRDKPIDLAALQVNGLIVHIEMENIVGQSIIEGNEISIHVDRNYWDKATYYDRELLLFHELGHAVLKRDHLNTKNDQQQCKSIMRSSSSICSCIYNELTRKQYIDELFN